MTDVETVIISSFVGAAVSYIGAVVKSALDFRSKVDESLIKTRTDIYKNLWKMTALLPKWPREENVTYEQVENLRKNSDNGILTKAVSICRAKPKRLMRVCRTLFPASLIPDALE